MMAAVAIHSSLSIFVVHPLVFYKSCCSWGFATKTAGVFDWLYAALKVIMVAQFCLEEV